MPKPKPKDRKILRANNLIQPVPWPHGKKLTTDLGGLKYDARQQMYEAIHKATLTHVCHGPVLEGGSHLPPQIKTFDLLDKPDVFAALCAEAYDAGIWNDVLYGLEDAPKAMKKYGEDGFIDKAIACIKAAKPFCAKSGLGVETNEWAAKWAGVKKTDPKAFWRGGEVAKAISQGAGVKLAIHWNKGYWGPDPGAHDWWKKYRAYVDTLWYQWGTKDVTKAMIVERTKKLRTELKKYGASFVAFEYEKSNLKHSIELGNEARKLGVPAANGCSI